MDDKTGSQQLMLDLGYTNQSSKSEQLYAQALADAICSPRGVIPPSAIKLVTPDVVIRADIDRVNRVFLGMEGIGIECRLGPL
jgi:hypothetical protein